MEESGALVVTSQIVQVAESDRRLLGDGEQRLAIRDEFAGNKKNALGLWIVDVAPIEDDVFDKFEEIFERESGRVKRVECYRLLVPLIKKDRVSPFPIKRHFDFDVESDELGIRNAIRRLIDAVLAKRTGTSIVAVGDIRINWRSATTLRSCLEGDNPGLLFQGILRDEKQRRSLH